MVSFLFRTFFLKTFVSSKSDPDDDFVDEPVVLRRAPRAVSVRAVSSTNFGQGDIKLKKVRIPFRIIFLYRTFFPLYPFVYLIRTFLFFFFALFFLCSL